MCSFKTTIEFKELIWNLFANQWSMDLEEYSRTVSLDRIDEEVQKILKGQQVGRVVIKHGV